MLFSFAMKSGGLNCGGPGLEAELPLCWMLIVGYLTVHGLPLVTLGRSLLVDMVATLVQEVPRCW